MANFTNTLFTYLTVIAQVLVIFFVFIYFKDRKSKTNVFNFLSKHGILIAFIVSSLSMIGSLLYSDVLGYEPCKFCWIQRIAMYPQVLLLGIALIRKDYGFYRYSIPLSIVGALLALNHYILQITGSSVLPCSAVGYSAACSKVFVLRLGYITIPMMALSAFLLMIIAMQFARHNETTTS
jgi:disulfide bond formation protein DsbB